VRLLLATSPIALIVACSPAFGELDSDYTTTEAFAVAAHTYDVPRDLLVAIGWTVTRLETPELHDHGGESAVHHGIMGLSNGAPTGPQLDRAAAALDVDPSVVERDEVANIFAAAAELRAYGDLWLEDNGGELTTYSDWAPVVAWYSGVDHTSMQLSFARDVYRWLENGLDVTLSDGELIKVEPHTIDVPIFGLQTLGAVSSDYHDTAQFIAASTSNYTNDNRSGSDIDMVVVHTAQGSYSGVAWWFADPAAGASAHYVIRSSDGEVTQMVWEEDVAWHAGDWTTNERSVGIEQEGYVEDPGRWYTTAMYQSLANLTADVCNRYGFTCDRNHVIGHNEVPGCSGGSGGGASCHTDPGSGFDWSYFMDLVAAATGGSSGSTGSSGGTTPTGATGALVGLIRADDIYTGAGISGATVTLSDGQRTTTDGTGWFEFASVSEGLVDLTASASGYDTAVDDKDVMAGVTNWNSMALTASSGGGSSSGGTTSTAGYSPTDWETVWGPDVTMDWPTSAAPVYQVQIYWHDGANWQSYYTYTTRDSDKTFWPAVDDTWYAWTVREFRSGSWSGWSAANYFWFEN